jgi:DNA-binding LacI/PurR family transcriptional regulator
MIERQNSQTSGYEAALHLIDTAAPTALLCTTDQLALGALRAARERGLDVPGDLSVTGFDDVPGAALAQPPLTTVRQPLVDKGLRAGELLIDLMGGGEHRDVELPVELVVRASTGPPPG